MGTPGSGAAAAASAAAAKKKGSGIMASFFDLEVRVDRCTLECGSLVAIVGRLPLRCNGAATFCCYVSCCPPTAPHLCSHSLCPPAAQLPQPLPEGQLGGSARAHPDILRLLRQLLQQRPIWPAAALHEAVAAAGGTARSGSGGRYPVDDLLPKLCYKFRNGACGGGCGELVWIIGQAHIGRSGARVFTR